MLWVFSFLFEIFLFYFFTLGWFCSLPLFSFLLLSLSLSTSFSFDTKVGKRQSKLQNTPIGNQQGLICLVSSSNSRDIICWLLRAAGLVYDYIKCGNYDGCRLQVWFVLDEPVWIKQIDNDKPVLNQSSYHQRIMWLDFKNGCSCVIAPLL